MNLANNHLNLDACLELVYKAKEKMMSRLNLSRNYITEHEAKTLQSFSPIVICHI